MEVILKLFLRDAFFASGFGSSNWYCICVRTLSCDSLLIITGVVLCCGVMLWWLQLLLVKMILKLLHVLLGQALVLPTRVCVKTLSCDSLLIVTGAVCVAVGAMVVAVGVGGDDCKVVVCVVGSGFGSSDSCLCQDIEL